MTRPLLRLVRALRPVGFGAVAALVVSWSVTLGVRTVVRAQDGEGASVDAGATRRAGFTDLRRIRRIVGDVEAGREKAELCWACHGPDGTSPVAVFPNLAGQRADYLYWELVEYQIPSRAPSAMTPIAASLDEQDMRDLAVFYAAQVPRAVPVTDPPDSAQLRRGEALFRSGDPARGIAPCQGCHGPDARGRADALVADGGGYVPFAVYPALRGQHAPYLQGRLDQFRAGVLGTSTTDFIMTDVARRLDEESVAALAAWLASLEP